jgi:hypothetical protein
MPLPGGQIRWAGLVLALALVASAMPAAGRGLAERTQAESVAENQPPYCDRVRADREVLRGREAGRFERVHLRGGGDPDGDPVSIWVGAVEQDEAVRTARDRTSPDARLAGDGARLRAERHRRGDGRVYLLRFTGSDPHGESCSGTARVLVERWSGLPARDSRKRFDSLRRR